MRKSLESLVEAVEARVTGQELWTDILADEPDVTIEEAYQVQFALMRRRVAGGDTVVGYKAAYTSLAMQRERGNGGPIVGAILRSSKVEEGTLVQIVPDSRNAVEAEVAILLGSDLPGPVVTSLDVMRATGALLPAIEVAVGAPGNIERSRHMVIATHKTHGSIIVGSPPSSPTGIDLRLEGMVITINGEVKGSATAVEVLGNPFNSAAFIANMLIANGEVLRAGMFLMTGSILPALPVGKGDDVRMEFTRLGSVHVRFAD